jgi:hypothetical protein
MEEKKSYWKVTTAGDVEYRTRKDLGIYEGDIIDIAFHLADKEVYELFFERIYPVEVKEFKPTGDKVNVRVDSMNYQSTKKHLSENDKDVIVNTGNIYKTVELRTKDAVIEDDITEIIDLVAECL